MVYCVLDFMFSSVVLVSRTAELVDRYSHTCRPSQSLRRLGRLRLKSDFSFFLASAMIAKWSWQVERRPWPSAEVLKYRKVTRRDTVWCCVFCGKHFGIGNTNCKVLWAPMPPQAQTTGRKKVCMVHLSKLHVYVQHLIWIKHKCSSKWNEFSSTVLWKMKRGDTEGLILTDS